MRPLVAGLLDPDVEPAGERIHHRGADAVQAARRRVGAAAELAARVQPGHDQLDAGQPGLRLVVDRDAAAVVVDLGRAVRVQGHVDPAAGARERLVDRIVEDLAEALRQAPAVGRADVHARPLADGVQALQHGQVAGGVPVCAMACACRRGSPRGRADGTAGRGWPRWLARRHRLPRLALLPRPAQGLAAITANGSAQPAARCSSPLADKALRAD